MPIVVCIKAFVEKGFTGAIWDIWVWVALCDETRMTMNDTQRALRGRQMLRAPADDFVVRLRRLRETAALGEEILHRNHSKGTRETRSTRIVVITMTPSSRNPKSNLDHEPGVFPAS